MRQWTAAKGENPDTLLFFRMGDFYELFYDDAIIASRELQITLTARDRERSISHVRRAVPRGRGLSSTPASQGLSHRHLRTDGRPKANEEDRAPRGYARSYAGNGARCVRWGRKQNNFLAAFHEDGATSSIALLDLSTGEFRTAEFHGPSAHQEPSTSC